ncbi:MAG TPA: hypothetical protein VGM31_14540 [Puia sp.]
MIPFSSFPLTGRRSFNISKAHPTAGSGFIFGKKPNAASLGFEAGRIARAFSALVHSMLKYMFFDSHTVFEGNTGKIKPRLLTVTESCRYYPRITISGAWLRDWGLSVGDRVFLLGVSAAEILIKVGNKIDESDISQYRKQAAATSTPEIGDTVSCYISRSSTRYCPEFILTGAWLGTWGFRKGDRISLTKVEDDHIIIKVIMPASEWRQIQLKRKLEREVEIATAALDRHKANHLSLYESTPEPMRKRITTRNYAKPSPLQQILVATREYNTDAAARSAKTRISRLTEDTSAAA